jgi:3-hydroxybutyryl-CoA dehydratase
MIEYLVERSLTVDDAHIRQYADLTGDFNPLHLDAEFAKQTPLGGVVAHGTMSSNLIWESLSATFGQRRCAGATVEIRFLKPVRPGDHVTAGGRRHISDRDTYDVWVRDQGGIEVIGGRATIQSTSD